VITWVHEATCRVQRIFMGRALLMHRGLNVAGYARPVSDEATFTPRGQ